MKQYKKFGFTLVQVLLALAFVLSTTACTPEMAQKAVVIEELQANVKFYSVLQPGNIPQIFAVYQNTAKDLYGIGWITMPGKGLLPSTSGGMVSKEATIRMLEALNRMPRLLPGFPAPATNGYATPTTWAQVPNDIKVYIINAITAVAALSGGVPMVTAMFTTTTGFAELDKILNPVGVIQ